MLFCPTSHILPCKHLLQVPLSRGTPEEMALGRKAPPVPVYPCFDSIFGAVPSQPSSRWPSPLQMLKDGCSQAYLPSRAAVRNAQHVQGTQEVKPQLGITG